MLTAILYCTAQYTAIFAALTCCALFTFSVDADLELPPAKPSPEKLVAVQPDFLRLYSRIGEQQDVAFTPEVMGRLNRFSDRATKTGKERHGRLPLGITGVIYWDMLDSPLMPVVGLYPGTPTEGLVREGDIIVGANGRLFTQGDDPRIAMGYAIYEAQSKDLGGQLTLAILRNGQGMNIKVPLGVAPRYAEDWPANCARSKQTLDTTVRYVVDHANADGECTSRHHSKGAWWNLLLLLSVDDDAALDVARRDLLSRFTSIRDDLAMDTLEWQTLEQMIRNNDFPIGNKPGGKASWSLGPLVTAASEYYLLTGDSSVLPIIAYQVHWLEQGQSPASGSWCHGLGFGGYGEVNSAGLGCFLGLALASKTPVPMKGEALQKSRDFFGKFAGSGIPYGNHPPEAFRRSDNGRNGNAAVAFAMLGEHELARAFARPTCYTYAAREWGHAENAFSFLWGPTGAMYAPDPEYRMFLDNQVWYYEIARVPYEGGGLLRAMRQGRFQEPFGAAGVMGLFMARPQHRIQILGASESVFAIKPPPRLRAAAEAYKLKQWKTFIQETDAVLAGSATVEEKTYAKRIREAYDLLERNAAHTLGEIRKNMASGEIAKAYYQLRALRLMLGEDREEMAELWAKLRDPEMKKLIKASEKQYNQERLEKKIKLADPLKEKKQ